MTDENSGLKAAEQFLSRFDPEARVQWRVAGPRSSRTTDIAAILVKIEGSRRMVIVQAFEGGRFTLYPEAEANELDALQIELARFYGGAEFAEVS